MAHYTWQIASPRGNNLRTGLDDLRSAQHRLLDELRAMNQMTNTEIVTLYGFADATTAGNAKAELASDVSHLNPASDGDSGTASGRALQQMLDQFA